MAYQLSIVTPEGKVFDDQIEGLSAPGTLGGFGVLSGHAPMVTALKAGPLKVTQKNTDKYYSIASGILEVNNEHNVLILSDAAIPAPDKTAAMERSKGFEKT